MNRTIKFRGRSVYNDEWVYGYLLGRSGKTEIYNVNPDGSLFWANVYSQTVGQFTGLYDANGLEIYEDDILCESGTDIFVEVVYDAPQFCYKDNDFGYKFLNHPENFEVVGNVHDNPEYVKKTENVGVALFGYPFLFQNGDLAFHESMEELGLTRGSIILGGLPNKCILANKHEYLLTDYDNEQDFCEQFKLKATYSVEDFIQGIKELKSEGGQQ